MRGDIQAQMGGEDESDRVRLDLADATTPGGDHAVDEGVAVVSQDVAEFVRERQSRRGWFERAVDLDVAWRPGRLAGQMMAIGAPHREPFAWGRPRPPPGPVTRATRFGHVTGHHPPAGEPGTGTYLVRDDQTGITYGFGYADIVTDGLRTIRVGERVRFLIDHAHAGQASYIIRLDLPDITEYYR